MVMKIIIGIRQFVTINPLRNFILMQKEYAIYGKLILLKTRRHKMFHTFIINACGATIFRCCFHFCWKIRHLLWDKSRSLFWFLCLQRCFLKNTKYSAKLNPREPFWSCEIYSEDWNLHHFCKKMVKEAWKSFAPYTVRRASFSPFQMKRCSALFLLDCLFYQYREKEKNWKKHFIMNWKVR